MGQDLSLEEARKRLGVSRREMAYLIRTGQVRAALEAGRLRVPAEQVHAYLAKPQETRRQRHASFLKTLGPGLITGASDDDPSGIGTYSQVGAAYGLGLSWLCLYLLPMMCAVQETVARIGIVTQHGLAHVIRERYGKRVLFPIVALLLLANTVNIGADIGAMIASLQLLVPVNFFVGAIVLTVAMTALEVFVPYHRYARILKFTTISLFGYVITAFIIHPDWAAVARSLVTPHIQLNAAFIAAIVAVMGTTITPYLFFWQAAEEVEEAEDKGRLGDFREVALNSEIKTMRRDTYTGMTFANVVFLAIIVTTAFVLHAHGITNVDSAQTAALALRPLAGQFASALFALGIFGVGLLAVPVLAGSSAYALAEAFGWREGLSRKPEEARHFYWQIIAAMLVGLALNFTGWNPIKALYYSAIVNGLAAPVIMFFVFRVGRDPGIMGKHTNPRWVNVWGTIATVLMGGAALLLGVFAFLHL